MTKRAINLARVPLSVIEEEPTQVPLILHQTEMGQKWQWAAVEVHQPWGDAEYWLLTYTHQQEAPDTIFPAKLERFISMNQAISEMTIRSMGQGYFERNLTNDAFYQEEAIRSMANTPFDFTRH